MSLSSGHQMSPQSLSLHQPAPLIYHGCGGVAVLEMLSLMDEEYREWSGVQPPAGLLSQQRGKHLCSIFNYGVKMAVQKLEKIDNSRLQDVSSDSVYGLCMHY